MFNSQITKINNDIKRTKRAIIALGCSFVQGSGAFSEDIYKNYKWNTLVVGQEHIQWELSNTDKHQLVSQYKDVSINTNGQPNLSLHQYNNAFANILAQKYFDGEYAVINLGIAGCGNRATIKELHYYPNILWDEIEEHIVIFCPSGMERLDFASDEYHDPNSHNRWKASWPRELDEVSSRAEFWRGYKDHVHSEKFQVLEQIAIIQELVLWCKYKDAKLIITPAFSTAYNKDVFRSGLTMAISRNHMGDFIRAGEVPANDKSIDTMIDMWPWENMFLPDGCPSFVDLTMKQEFGHKWESTHFYSFVGSGSPEGWITPCAHPSAKAHDVFAEHLYKHITENKK